MEPLSNLIPRQSKDAPTTRFPNGLYSLSENSSWLDISFQPQLPQDAVHSPNLSRLHAPSNPPTLIRGACTFPYLGSMSSQSNLATQISTALTTSKSLIPTPIWLQTFLQSQKSTTPLPALTQTALFRLLASDITTTLSSSPPSCFPSDTHNAGIKERQMDGPVVVQVLSVEDMSKSRWEQIEAIEALERGEGTKGREIIRVPVAEDGTDDPVAMGLTKGGGPHKLLLQDARGERAYGIELKSVDGVGLGMSIGSKMVLRGVRVARAVVLLEPRTTILLGGKIEGLHKQWREGRKEELRKAIETSEREGRGS